MKRIWVVIGLALSLSACAEMSGVETQRPDYARIDRDAKLLCAAAYPLAPLAGPYAGVIIGFCATEAGIARLASDPASIALIHEIVTKLKH